MAEIGRSFDELDKKIKQVSADIKAADGEVRKLDKSLRLNPGNVDTVRQKYTALSNSLQLNTQKLTALKQKQDALNSGLTDGSISQSNYEKELIKVRKQIAATEASVQDLTVALQGQNAAIREAKYTSMISGLDKAERATSKLSRATLVLVGALAAVVKAAIDQGSALDDTAKKYGTTAEALQLNSRVYERLTGNADGYTASLAKIGSMQSSIAAGRGARYLKYLEELGLSEEDLAHKTNAEIYNTIYDALRKVTDATDRAIIAQGLLGDEGLNLAIIAGSAASEIEAVQQQLIETGIITNEQAAIAGLAGDQLDNLKYAFQANAAAVLVSLMPAFQALCDFLQQSVIPALTSLANWFANLGTGGQKLLLLTLAIIIVLPKIIALVKGIVGVIKLMTAATTAQAAATGALTAASTPWLGIIMAISAALLLVVSLINMFIGKADAAVDTTNSLLGSLGETESMLNGMGYALDYSAEQTHNTNTKREVDVNVQVVATGDGTEIDENNAERIAGYVYDQISIDLINQCLGAVAR